MLSRLRRGGRPLRWSVVVAAPKGEAGAQWGDTWFAADLVDALNRAGQDARTVFRGGATSEARDADDVVLEAKHGEIEVALTRSDFDGAEHLGEGVCVLASGQRLRFLSAATIH